MNAIELAIFSGKLNAICEEMGYTLQRSAFSPNIKDRLDFSCALFDVHGHICAQAAHIPVHLGSMAYAMKDIVSVVKWCPDDVLVMNDPFKGGTHLPDVTLIQPFFLANTLSGFVVCRAHHANIGAVAAGSMPLSSALDQEGILIEPRKLFDRGRKNHETHELLSPLNRQTDELPADFLAQLSAVRLGVRSIEDWLSRQGAGYFDAGVKALNAYGATIISEFLSRLEDGTATFSDYLDDDGFGRSNLKICMTLTKSGGRLSVDFSGTEPQAEGNLNCPLSVAAASVYYVVMCLLPDYTPCCQGVFESVDIQAPEGCLVNALPGAAVAAGNVETSMRIVDTMLGACAGLGVKIPAASQGTMNNLAMGTPRGSQERGSGYWEYYETIAGGCGASMAGSGLSGKQSHMTNTLNTPIESLEMHYPLMIEKYGLRAGSGGEGQYSGGDGVERVYRFLQPTEFTLLTERRRMTPWGVEGGGPGKAGQNMLNNDVLPAKVSDVAGVGDTLSILTPGGGGYGQG